MSKELIREMLVHMYPDAAKIEVFINSQEMTITPVYVEPIGYTMKNVSGKWINKKVD